MKTSLSPRMPPRRWLVAVGIAGLALAASAAGPATSGAAHGPQYLLGSQANMLNLLPPPPATDSQAQRDDLQAVLEAQRDARANGTIQHAIADVDLSCGSIADALGDPAALVRDARGPGFLTEAAREAASLTGTPKNTGNALGPLPSAGRLRHWATWPRAAKALTAAQAAVRKVDTGGPADLAHTSYPSGHSAFGTVCAILLADMVPEKEAALFARGLDFAHSRMVLGAHFPSDLEGGRLTGTVGAELLMQNASFQRDFAMARKSLRAALGLPTEAGDLGGAYQATAALEIG